MQDSYISQKIEQLMFEVSKSQSLDAMQQARIEDFLQRCARIASQTNLNQNN